MSQAPVIGIDFGTSYSTVCWWNPKLEAPEVIRNEHGEDKTPSVVYHGQDEVLVGKAALEQLAECSAMKPEQRDEILGRTFRSVKRLLRDNLPLALPDGDLVTPIDLAGDILWHLKQSAEKGCFNGERVDSVVLTHPVVFNRKEKANLIEAAALAGLRRITLVEEPVAAIHGYRASGATAGQKILVFDMGGGTLDLAYLEWDGAGAHHMPIAPAGEETGGDELDLLVYEHIERQLKSRHGVGFGGNTNGLNLAVLNECRKVKEKLTTMGRARLSHFMAEQNRQEVFELTRAEFEQLILNQASRAADLAKGMTGKITAAGRAVDTVLLVGGSTRVPLVQRRLREVLPVAPLETMHADVAVAMGAACLAEHLKSGSSAYGSVEIPAPPISFADALEKGDASAVLRHLRTGSGVNEAVDGNVSGTPLVIATTHGQLEVCKILVQWGADAFLADGAGICALHTAAFHERDRVLEYLLSIDQLQSKDGLHELRRSCLLGDLKWIHGYLRNGPDINATDCYGMTPLMWACSGGQSGIVDSLLDEGADVAVTTATGNAAIHFAARRGVTGVCQALLDKEVDVDARASEQKTALHFAAQYGRRETARELLDHGAEIEARTKDEWTPLHFAASNGHEAVAGLLLDRDAEIEARDQWQFTPLHRAAHAGHEAVAKLLLNRGAEINVRAKNELTPLHRAAHAGHEAVAKLLLDRGAEIEARAKGELTPLHAAAVNGHEVVARLLLDRGAEIDARAKHELTPLHLAAFSGYESVARLLLDRGANIDARTAQDKTPLNLAVGGGHEAIVKLLAEREKQASDSNSSEPSQASAGVKRTVTKFANKVFTIGRHRAAKSDPNRIAVSIRLADSEDAEDAVWATLWLKKSVADARMRPGTRGSISSGELRAVESTVVDPETGSPYLKNTVFPTKGSIKVSFVPPRDKVVKDAERLAGETISISIGDGVTMDLVWIPPGNFLMGSPENEPDRCSDEGPQHRVTISSGFWMGKTEVTQRQYQELMGDNPSQFKDAGLDAPVEQVDWNQAKSFCERLQDRMPAELRGMKARLPTEAEWEYACRAGTTGPFAGDLDGMGWYTNTSRGSTHAVGGKTANAWGLYDMHGNVWEWCWDGKWEYTSEAQTDPEGEGSSRVLRGGGWFCDAGYCRSARRNDNDPGDRDRYVGFRVVVR